MNKKLLINLSIVFVIATAFTAGIVIPEKYKSMKNPVKTSATSISAGKDLFTSKCKSCHGVDGKKNGDFTSAEFKKNTDGGIYYMSIVGGGKMPNFEKKITDENDRWNLVNYVKSMK